jgi:hypothetical protein
MISPMKPGCFATCSRRNVLKECQQTFKLWCCYWPDLIPTRVSPTALCFSSVKCASTIVICLLVTRQNECSEWQREEVLCYASSYYNTTQNNELISLHVFLFVNLNIKYTRMEETANNLLNTSRYQYIGQHIPSLDLNTSHADTGKHFNVVQLLTVEEHSLLGCYHGGINWKCLLGLCIRLCGLVVRVPGYRRRGPVFDSQCN